MGLLDKLFGPRRRQAPASQTQLASGVSKVPPGAARVPGSHKELVASAVRDTLARNGIPPTWITAETLAARSRTGVVGVHLRLLVHHWDPRLMLRLVPFQNALVTRLHRLDPVAEQWLTGIAWQFSLPDESVCPPLPHPGSWTAISSAPRAREAEPSGTGVIEGPVHVADAEDRRRHLDRMMEQTDAAYREQAQRTGYEKTQPVDLKTEPMELRTDPGPLRKDD